ncbi:MAG: YjbQ family protein [Armatimonadetes bacterium]|nr:YjbQ family protein [Armatimonadota bacterium]
METLNLRTHQRDEVVDITDEVRRAVTRSGVKRGICLVYCPHTTAAVVVNEGYDPDVTRDVLMVLDRLVPWIAGYRHAEGNTASHVKAILCGSSQPIPIENGQLVLGTWQAIQFYEFDGPRTREVRLFVQEAGQ